MRPISMGGAGVASERGSFAPYYNPAMLAFRDHATEVSLSVSLGMREVNLADSIDKLAEIDLNESFSDFANDNPQPGDPVPDYLQQDIATIQEQLLKLADENGLHTMPSLALGIQAKRFGFGFFGVAEIAANAVIDTDRLAFIVETAGIYHGLDNGVYTRTSRENYEAHSLEYAVINKLTYVQIMGLAYAEIPVAYGHAFETPAGHLAVGGALKLLPGRTVDMRIDVDTESDSIQDDIEDAQQDATSWGVDVGLAFRPSVVRGFTVGLAAKNLNTPSFDTVTDGTLKVQPQVRAGLAFDPPGRWLTLAADVDLTANETLLSNVNAQYAGAGLNIHPFSWLCLRGGAMVNLAEADDGLIWTAGLGIGLKWFQVDVAGQYSTETSTINEDEAPRYFRGEVALVSKWF
jgi:hypothetical protein